MNASHLRIVREGEETSIAPRVWSGDPLPLDVSALEPRSGVGLSWLNLRDALVFVFVISCAAYLAHVLGVL